MRHITHSSQQRFPEREPEWVYLGKLRDKEGFYEPTWKHRCPVGGTRLLKEDHLSPDSRGRYSGCPLCGGKPDNPRRRK